MSVSFADIEAAAVRIADQVVTTPLLRSPALNARLGAQVLIKAETLQRGGAFKFRGAYNRIRQLTEAQRKAGVVAFSSGNHAQGVAIAAGMVGCPALIVMPNDAPTVKVEATRGYGAEIVFYDRFTEDRVEIALQIAENRGAVLVPAFDDPDVIAGQGTLGLELAAQAAEIGAAPGIVLCPIGGGGLASGVGLALAARMPGATLVGVEPQDFDDTLRSLRTGAIQTNSVAGGSFCDALLSPAPSALTLSIMQRVVNDVVLVTDAEVAEAMRYAFAHLKLVVEPGGCVGLAALLSGKVDVKGSVVALVLSGGNVDPALFGRVLSGEL